MYDGAAFASCGRKTEVTAHTDERLSNGCSSPSSSAAEIVGVGENGDANDACGSSAGDVQKLQSAHLQKWQWLLRFASLQNGPHDRKRTSP